MDAAAAGDGDGAPPEERTPAPPAPAAVAAAPAPASASGGGGPSGSGEKTAKRMMKTPYQLDVLEQTYQAEQYPTEAMRADLSVKIGLSDRQLQMWFCHRRLKDRKQPPAKKQRRDDDVPAAPLPVSPALPPLHAMPLASSDLMTYDEPLHPVHPRRGPGRSSAVPRISGPDIGRRYYEPLPVMLAPPVAPMHYRQDELRIITSVESQLGEPMREDGPVLGNDFDPLPPGAFGAPIVPEQQKQPVRSYDAKIFSRHDPNLLKVSSFLPSMEHPFVPNSFAGKRKSTVANPPQVHPHGGSRAVHEYQFLPEQPSETYDRGGRSHYYDTPVEASNSRVSSLNPGAHLLHGSEEMVPGYTFEGQGLLPQSGRPQLFPAVRTDYETNQSNSNLNSVPIDGQFGISEVAGFEDPLASSETRAYHDEDASRVDRKRKHNEEAKIAKEVEAHERRIRKELEKQDILRRKREEQMRKEMERNDRERKKEEERFLRERQREEERLQREQRREHERMEKFLQKQSRRAEKQRQKEELRKEKEVARQKAAGERATARRIAREYMELVEDERLELMELAAQSKGLHSMLCLDSNTLQQLDSFRGMLSQFPPEMVRLKVPFSIKPWTGSEDCVGKLLMIAFHLIELLVWKFLITFADVLGLSSVTLDEFVQSLHDYDSRLLGELHVALLKSIIKDIEDVSRTPSAALGVNPGGGHPQIVEGAYSWGFNIRNWQRHLNLLTWPEILRQFALSAGFGPQLKKRNAEDVFYRDENEGRDSENVISTLRNGSAAVRAAALMKERGYTHRRSRHRLTPGTVKFAAFHVLSLEESSGLTILEVAEKIQKSGLRDLTTSKTPEASIAAALSRDTKLFERTAPSTYCVKSPYRKDPADSEAVLSAAREKIRAFQNVLSDSEAEKEVDDVDRDDDSECDDDPDGDDVNIDVVDEKDLLLAVKAQDVVATATEVGDIKGKIDSLDTALTQPISLIAPGKGAAMLSLGNSNAAGTSSVSPLRASSDHHEVITGDAEDTEIDESNQGESWVQGLSEGDYCDLSVEERLNALVALVGVATEGNSIRAVLEERLEAANAIKKQMWADAQLDKRRSKEDFAGKMQYNSYTTLKADVPEHNATETTPTPVRNLDIDNDGNVGAINNSEMVNQHSQSNAGNLSYERNGAGQDISATPDVLSAQQYAYADKTRSQLKLYIGHRAEQLYVYRSLPLGQDRRRNRYWQFSTSASPNDPGSGRIFFESKDGHWRVIDSEEVFDSLVASLDTRGSREAQLHSMLQRVESTFKEGIKRKRSAAIEQSNGRHLKNGATDMVRANYRSEFGSPSSSLSSVSADSATAYSDSFKIELGRNDVEKIAISKRADGFLKWMWRECFNRQQTCAMKYGKKRCSALMCSCDYCYQIYLAEERHCSSCHKTFKSIHNFSEHTSQCEERRRTDPNWKMQIADYAVPIGMRLLKLQLATIEASVPSEALQPFWSDGYRKSWAVKLHSTTSVEEIFQMLTLLEGAIRRDYLSSDFETSNELLNSKTQDMPSQSPFGLSGISVLPWVPDTTAAITLRMLDLDYAVSYIKNEKKERDGGDSVVS
ncbi:hypothetical protein ACQ4PT_043854 [Festuca glaucescens]